MLEGYYDISSFGRLGAYALLELQRTPVTKQELS